MTTQTARFCELAASYHGGQMSALYSFLSMGGNWHHNAWEDWNQLDCELSDALKCVKVGDKDYEDLLEFQLYAETMANEAEEDDTEWEEDDWDEDMSHLDNRWYGDEYDYFDY